MRRWYVVQTYSGYEDSVKDDLESRKDSMGLQDKVYQILVPEEEIEVVDKKNNKKIKKQKLYPGYIFVEMEVEKEIDDNTWFIIRNTPKVTGFLGSSGKGTKPVAVPTDEMNRILKMMGQVAESPFKIQVGDTVEVVSGLWIGQTGVVSNINEEKKIVTIMIEMFGGRATPSELQFDQVKKLD